MRLPLTDQLQERLRHVRESQFAERRAGFPHPPDEIFLEKEVVRLKAGMGHSVYLELDGTVYAVNYGEGLPPEILESPKDMASCIIRWASNIGLPELIEALPPIPEGGDVCSLCRGSRYMPDSWVDEQGRRVYCHRCGGLGWTLPAQSTSSAGSHW